MLQCLLLFFFNILLALNSPLTVGESMPPHGIVVTLPNPNMCSFFFFGIVLYLSLIHIGPRFPLISNCLNPNHYCLF